MCRASDSLLTSIRPFFSCKESPPPRTVEYADDWLSARRDPQPLRILFRLARVFADAAVAALAALEVSDGLEQMNAPEVRTEPLGDKDLGVGNLPQQEVRDAELARGAD